MGDLAKAMSISAAGMKAQGVRTRVIAENLANADSTGTKPGADPYRRKSVTFQTVMDREAGVARVGIGRIKNDDAEFGKKYDPDHPAADEEGYVKTPNVNPLVEMMDMREAQASNQANISALEISRSMLKETLGLLNAQ